MAKEWNMMRDLNAPMGGGQEIIEFVGVVQIQYININLCSFLKPNTALLPTVVVSGAVHVVCALVGGQWVDDRASGHGLFQHPGECADQVADGGLEEMGEAWEFPSETSYGDGDSVRESTDLSFSLSKNIIQTTVDRVFHHVKPSMSFPAPPRYSNGNRYEGQWLDDKRPAAQSSAVRRKRVDGSFDRGHGRGLFACAEDRVNWAR